MKGGFPAPMYLQGTCHDTHEQSGINKFICECHISYSTLISIVLDPSDRKYYFNMKYINKYEYIQKHYAMKPPTCALEVPNNNANRCLIQSIIFPYKFVSP